MSGCSLQNLLGKNSAPTLSYPAGARRTVARRVSSAYALARAPRTEKTVIDDRKIRSHTDLVPTAPSLQRPKTRVKVQPGYSSGESDEEEHIVEIASPSSLFQTHNSVW